MRSYIITEETERVTDHGTSKRDGSRGRTRSVASHCAMRTMRIHTTRQLLAVTERLCACSECNGIDY